MAERAGLRYSKLVWFMWYTHEAEDFIRRAKRFAKKHRRELMAVLSNTHTYLLALQAGAKPQHRPFGFMHSEGHGVWAIDQKGGGKNLAETRLYVFPDADAEVLHQITLGDKGTQVEDIKLCTNYVAELKKRKPVENEPDTGASQKGAEGEEAP